MDCEKPPPPNADWRRQENGGARHPVSQLVLDMGSSLYMLYTRVQTELCADIGGELSFLFDR